MIQWNKCASLGGFKEELRKVNHGDWKRKITISSLLKKPKEIKKKKKRKLLQ